jgi:hypothetical protein
MMIRLYVFTARGIKLMPRSALEKAIHGTLPEYANKRLKVAEVCLRTKDRKPVEILKTHGFFMEFDETGNARQVLAKFAIRALDTDEDLQRSKGKMNYSSALPSAPKKKLSPVNVIDLNPTNRFLRENRWVLSAKDLDQLSAVIWQKR